MLLAVDKLCKMRAFLSVGLADVHTNPVPQNGKDFIYRTCMDFSVVEMLGTRMQHALTSEVPSKLFKARI